MGKKFKAWDIENKKMVDVIDFACMNYPDKYKVMQFSGASDKTGKEIYEGDILNYKTIKVNDYWEVFFDEKKLQFRTKCLNRELNNQSLWHLLDKHIKVGNIYENPDLCSSPSSQP